MKALKVSAPLVDARGRPCPWPIIELAKALKAHPQVELWADDPAARADLDSFCEATKARLMSVETSGAVLQALVARFTRERR
jgi:TusA-related sulfurtransferase